MINTKSKELQKLRQLILQEDQERVVELEKELEILRASINDTDVWLEKLDPILADALSLKISESKEEMAQTLAPVMGAAIKTQIQDAKDDMVDALYPVIGSTIRKSIAEAMKTLVKTINERVDRVLSFQLLINKAKSKVTGVSEGELVLKDALPFQIHEIFLIHKKSGILLSHMTPAGGLTSPDQEIVSGMLTAIRDFAKTAFDKNGSRELHEIKYEDLQIYLEDGRYAYLAAVVSEFPPDNFTEHLKKYEHQIHNRFHKQLRAFDGNVAPLEGTSGILRKLLAEFSLQHEEVVEAEQNGKSSAKGLVYLLSLVLIGLLSYLGFFWIPQWRTEKKILAQIEGLRKNEPIFANSKLSFEVDSRTVFIGGFAQNEETKNRIAALITVQPDVETVENNLRITLSQAELDRVLQEIEKKLSGELSVSLFEHKNILDGDVLTIEGRVSSSREKTLIGHEISKITPLRMLVNNLTYDELRTIPSHIQKQIEQIVIHFGSNSSKIPESEKSQLHEVIEFLKSYRFEKIYIHSHSDSYGDESVNSALSEERARRIENYLTTLGVSPDQIKIVAWGAQNPIATNETDEGRALNRRVEFTFSPTKTISSKE